MDKMTAEIRAIVRDEIKKMGATGMATYMNENEERRHQSNQGLWKLLNDVGDHTKEFVERRKPIERKSEREGSKWSSFETDLLRDAFSDFCLDRSLKTGRSMKSISCKVRRMMYEGQIRTWE